MFMLLALTVGSGLLDVLYALSKVEMYVLILSHNIQCAGWNQQPGRLPCRQDCRSV